ncbi:Hsp20/alpha crystallin family protein [Thermoactinospora rubra]|uniref:Hsp20/alpha crystallin family protein n=1 Tax=Thermoactinospora rubra TaxID=1088767 RepID=UPI000A10C5A9|nr:Hsp20/alpha crystallin family protein [Thermoactinospora rubra]
MLLTSFDPILKELEQLTRHVLHGTAGMVPMDGIRRPGEVVLRFDVPGIDPGSIEVTVDRGILTVSGKREETYDDGERLFVDERPKGAFMRRVYLPEHLDADGIQAACNNGVLVVRIPVLEQAQPRKVEIAKGETPFLTK